MKVLVGTDRVLHLRWRYDPYEATEEGQEPAPRTTHCQVTEDDGTIMGYGEARCSGYDNFNKATGRKISLERAVKDLPREVRGKLLYAYFNRKRELKNEVS